MEIFDFLFVFFCYMSFFIVGDVGLEFGGRIQKILRVMNNKMPMTYSF